MQKYEDFEIVVEGVSGYDIYAVNVRQPCGGKAGDASGSFKLEELFISLDGVQEKAPEENQRQIMILENGKEQQQNVQISFTKPCTDEESQQFGVNLKNALFKPDIARLWGECRSISRQNNAALRIRLDLSSAPKLAQLPWEYLRMPDNSNFVALDADATLIRYLRTAAAARPLNIAAPLRVLAVVSSPQEAVPLNTNREIEQIKKAFRELSTEIVEVQVLTEAATIENIKAVLKKADDDGVPFHILHYIGHGAFSSQTNKGYLIFENDNKRAVAVSHEDFGRALKPFNDDLRLVVLNACEGARLSLSDVYSSVAAKTLQISEIPAVVAMQFSISDPAAIAFAARFYTQLAAGESLEKAVDEGRLKVREENMQATEWATPVFYLRGNSGNLFDLKIPVAREELQSHYDKIKSVASSGNLVVFLGLDVNLLNRPYYDPWKPGRGLPTPAQMCAYLSGNLKINPPRDSLARLAKQLQLEKNESLTDLFGGFFKENNKPSKLHNVLARLTKKVVEKSSKEVIDPCHCRILFVTTTYDYALENALKAVGVTNYDTVTYVLGGEADGFFTHKRYRAGELESSVSLAPPNAPNEYQGLRTNLPVILKLPGEVAQNPADETGFAITEDDFFKFAFKTPSEIIPADLLGQINTSNHLYLGYDLQNWTSRLLYYRVCENQKPLKRENSYAVVQDEQKDPNALFWKENKVKSVNVSLDDYVEGLDKFVVEQF